MAHRKRFSANEVLKQLQEIPCNISGDDGENSGDQEANELHVQSEDSSSSCSEDSVEPLRKRIFLADVVQDARPSTSTEVNRGGTRVHRSQTAFTSHDEEAAEECDSELDEPRTPIQPGKDGTVWRAVRQGNQKKKRPLHNIVSIAPGPTTYSKQKIHTAFDAFRILIDVTMMNWIMNYTEMEANR